MKHSTTRFRAGTTVIDLLVYLASVAFCLAGFHSWLAGHSIRMKIDEVVSVADAAKTAIEITCTEDPKITELSSSRIGHQFPVSGYVESISLGGSCGAPVITVLTMNTGLVVNPKLTFTGVKSEVGGQLKWSCSSDGLEVHVPKSCHG